MPLRQMPHPTTATAPPPGSPSTSAPGYAAKSNNQYRASVRAAPTAYSSSTRAANMPSSAKPSPVKHGWRWHASPPNYAHEHPVVYIHYEEGDPASTIERLRLLGVTDDLLMPPLFRFIAPNRPAHKEWIADLLNPAPTLVIHDGVNEAMSLHGAEIGAAEGASTFRRHLIVPFLCIGAATIACDHVPMVRDASRRDAYGSVHKGNTLNGARIALENRSAFGRELRGVSHVFITKDRPGHLRACGRPTSVPGKTYMGTLVGDASDPLEPFSLMFHAPRDDDESTKQVTETLAETVWEVIAAQPDSRVTSQRMLFAVMRKHRSPVHQRESLRRRRRPHR